MKTNKTNRRIISLFLSIIFVISLLASTVSAIPVPSMNINVRIEGISQDFYDQSISVPYATPTLSVQAMLAYLDTQTPDVTITGVASGFISDVNGDASGTFGGWDGWLFLVNSAAPSTGIDATSLQDGDTVVLYYGDPFGVGFQYPDVDSSRISSGILKFTSQDTTFDVDWNPIVTTNSIAGATVTWYYDSTTATYTTDVNGEIVIPEDQRSIGDHRFQIEKYGTTAVSGKYLPLVLRLSKNAYATVTAASSSSSSSSTSSSGSSSSPGSSSLTSSTSSSDASGNPHMGDFSMVPPVIGAILSLAVIAIFIRKKKQKARE